VFSSFVHVCVCVCCPSTGPTRSETQWVLTRFVGYWGFSGFLAIDVGSGLGYLSWVISEVASWQGGVTHWGTTPPSSRASDGASTPFRGGHSCGVASCWLHDGWSASIGDGDGGVLTLGAFDLSPACCWPSWPFRGCSRASLHRFPVERGGYRWPVTPRGQLRYVPLGFSSASFSGPFCAAVNLPCIVFLWNGQLSMGGAATWRSRLHTWFFSLPSFLCPPGCGHRRHLPPAPRVGLALLAFVLLFAGIRGGSLTRGSLGAPQDAFNAADRLRLAR